MKRVASPPKAPPVPALRVNDLLFLNEYFRNGQNGTQAYLTTHPGVKYGSAEVGAQRVLGRRRVQEELARRVRYDAGITKAFVSSRLLEYEDMAYRRGDYIAGASIAMDAARLGGHLIDKREVTTLTDDQRRSVRALVQQVAVHLHPARASESAHLSDGATNGREDTKSAADASGDATPHPTAGA